MAINLTTQYPGKVGAATASYPYGEPRNITTPGDGTGTPWEAAYAKDDAGFKQSLLSAAAIVPSGTPDAVGASEYLDAINILIDNKLDVRSGSFTPTFEGLTTPGTGWVYATQAGRWNRMGNIMLLNFQCRITTKSSDAVGPLVMRGIPFPSEIGTLGATLFPSGTLTFTNGFTLSANNGYLTTEFQPSSANDGLFVYENYGISNKIINITDMSNNTIMIGTIVLPLLYP